MMTPQEFMEHPTHEQWLEEIDKHGWRGPDGSSASFDSIQGIRVGIMSASYEKNLAPDGDLYAASGHDWRHQLGRRLDLPTRYSGPNDRYYRDRCLQHTAHLMGWSGWKARRSCWFRWRVLRARVYARAMFGLKPWGKGS
jgi:hypothetical protein